MAYTRPWTRAEERQVKACPRALLRQIARKLQRSSGGVMARWKKLHRNATRARKYHEGRHSLLPAHVPKYDPAGIVCMTCQQEKVFGTIDGRAIQECKCGRAYVPRRNP